MLLKFILPLIIGPSRYPFSAKILEKLQNSYFPKAIFFLHTLCPAWLQRSSLVFKIKRQFFLKTFEMVSFSRKPSLHGRRSKRKGKGIRARELPLPLLTPATQATVNPEQNLRLSLPSLLVQYVLSPAQLL